MELEVKTLIQAPPEIVWKTVTDIDNAAKTIAGIESVEVLQRPASGIVGLKWKETRTLFGKTAQETMWITDASEPEFYKTRAESHGSIYVSTIGLKEKDGGTELSMRFSGQPVTLSAKFFLAALGFLFKGATKKALAKDLQDIKAAVEGKTAQSVGEAAQKG
jgi:carbon monoxide dehydrogenase subunit G